MERGGKGEGCTELGVLEGVDIDWKKWGAKTCAVFSLEWLVALTGDYKMWILFSLFPLSSKFSVPPFLVQISMRNHFIFLRETI